MTGGVALHEPSCSQTNYILILVRLKYILREFACGKLKIEETVKVPPKKYIIGFRFDDYLSNKTDRRKQEPCISHSTPSLFIRQKASISVLPLTIPRKIKKPLTGDH